MKNKRRHAQKKINKKHYDFNSCLENIYANKNTLNYTEPANKNQYIYHRYLNNHVNKVVVACGPAGTGKTLFACEQGLRHLLDKKINKIIITRPTVTTSDDIGFLPGTLEDKMDPWLIPIYDIFNQHLHCNDTKELIKNKIIEIVPLNYMRGRTFKNAWIVADEMQNATINQTKMLLTRIGENSKLIITGDPEQFDRKDNDCGLRDFVYRIRNHTSNFIKLVKFDIEDIKREPVVIEILNIYGDSLTTSTITASLINRKYTEKNHVIFKKCSSYNNINFNESNCSDDLLVISAHDHINNKEETFEQTV